MITAKEIDTTCQTNVIAPPGPRTSSIGVWFIVSASVILALTGVAKVWTAFTPAKVLEITDPVTRISFGHLMLAVGVLELVIVSLCLFAKSQTLKLGLIAWLATDFLVYRTGLWWMGWRKPCGCLGNLTDAIGITPQTADYIIKVLLAYLLIGSYGLLIWDWWRRKQARLEFATTNHTNYTNAG